MSLSEHPAGRLKLGAFLPPWGPTATPDEIDEAILAIEGAGYASLWVGDHVVFPRRIESPYPYNSEHRSPFDPDQPLYEPATLLAYIAARTSRVRLGISVLVLPQREPLLAAKQLAVVDALSRGRLVTGVGVGWMREEFEALGMPFQDRGPRTDEWIAILRHAWTQPHESFHGRFRSFEPLGMLPSRPIPILVGGQTAPALRRAAALGDGWNGVRLSPDEVRAAVADLRRLGARPSFEIVVRGPLDDPRRLSDYLSAGVDEYVVEVPNATTAQRVRRFRALASAAAD
jgi:probable F420-dependent oxidoreductase